MSKPHIQIDANVCGLSLSPPLIDFFHRCMEKAEYYDTIFGGVSLKLSRVEPGSDMIAEFRMANQSVVDLICDVNGTRIYAQRKDVKELRPFSWSFRDLDFEPYFKAAFDSQLKNLLKHRYAVDPHGTDKLRAVLEEVSR